MRTLINNDRIGGTPARFGRTALVIQLALALVVVGYVVSNQRIAFPGASNDFDVRVAFADAAGLNPDHRPPVMVAGVVLGQVTKVDYDRGRAMVTLQLRGSAKGKIHRNATARITPRSAINDLTVDIDPGTSGTLDEGDVIGPAGNSSPVGLDRVLGVLNADSRAYAQVLLAQARIGLRGRTTEVHQTLAQLSSLMDPTTRVAAAMADRRADLRHLVDNLDVLFGTLGRRGDQLEEVVSYGRKTLDATSAQSTALRASVERLPTTLAALQSGLAGVTSLEKPLGPALTALRPAAARLPKALAALRRFTPQATGLVGDLDLLAKRGSTSSANLARLLGRVGPASESLNPAVADLEPTLSTLNSALPGYARLGDNFSGIFSTNDANGPRLRAYGFFEPPNPANLGLAGASTARVASMLVRAFTKACEDGSIVSCLTRYLVPGLPGSVQKVIPTMTRAPLSGAATPVPRAPGRAATPAALAPAIDTVLTRVQALLEPLIGRKGR